MTDEDLKELITFFIVYNFLKECLKGLEKYGDKKQDRE
jgi:hypothetical protein